MENERKISEQLADVAVNLRYEDLPEEAHRHACNLVMDILGSVIGSKNVESSRIAVQQAMELGGPEESDLVGYNKKVSAPAAAFANAIQSYAYDFADDHNESNCHPSVATIPASLALGQKLHVSGKELITAIALGNEVVCRLGSAFLGKTYYQGFHPTSTCGIFGTAISSAKLLKLDSTKTVWGLGIAGSQAAGLMEWNAEGSIVKRLQAGHPAMCGMLSSLLAAKGFTGPSTIIEGDSGFLNAYSLNRTYDASLIVRDFGKKWDFVNSSIKFYPCCRYSGGHLDACLEIARKYHPDSAKIRQISIRSSDYTIKLLTLPLHRKLRPLTIVDSQFSMPFQSAVALVKGRIDVNTFTESCFKDPEILALIPKVEWKVDEEFERRYPESYSCAVTVTMEDGQQFTSVIDNPKGDYRNPMTQDEIENKFKNLARIEIADEAKISRIISFIKQLDRTNDIGELFTLLRS